MINEKQQPDCVSIILVRHGQTEWNVEGRWQGQQDSPLTEQGLGNAKKLGRVIL